MRSNNPTPRSILFGTVPVKVVASRTGFHLSYLYLVLGRQRRLSWEGAAKVARALKLSLDELQVRLQKLQKAAKATKAAKSRRTYPRPRTRSIRIR